MDDGTRRTALEAEPAPSAPSTDAVGPVEGGPVEGGPVEDGAIESAGDEPHGGDLEDVPPGLAYQLRFDQFRHVGTLSLAAAGGTLALLQAGYLGSDAEPGVAVALFATAAALSVFGQDQFLDGLEAGRGRTRVARLSLAISLVLLGAGAGFLLGVVL